MKSTLSQMEDLYSGLIVSENVTSLKESKIHVVKVVFRHSETNTENGEDVLRKEGGFGWEGGHQGSCADCLDEEYDVVVVAAPQTRDKTKIAGAEYQKHVKDLMK